MTNSSGSLSQLDKANEFSTVRRPILTTPCRLT